ncbi:MAG: hypothetical protein ABL923_14450 [Burkholderiaceae bacterium]
MKNNLQSIRHEYNDYFKSTVFPLLGITEDRLDRLGFEEIALLIRDATIRRKFRRLAIQLLEANLHEHQTDRPSAIALFDAQNVSELRDWQDVSLTWEKALWALASQNDT